MATAQEIETAIAILVGGRVASAGVTAAKRVRAEQLAFKALGRRSQARVLATGAARAGKFVGRQAITKNPWGVAALLAYEGYIRRDEIVDVAGAMGAGIGATFEGMEELVSGEKGGLVASKFPAKRKVSKANKAVKHAMSLLKAGTKASTGADKGKLSKGAFKIAVKAAGLANPNTKSIIGKGKSITKALARKLKKWWK